MLAAFSDAETLRHAELDGVKDRDALSQLPPGVSEPAGRGLRSAVQQSAEGAALGARIAAPLRRLRVAPRVTAPRVTAQLRQFRERVTDKAFERKAVAALKAADYAEGKAAIRELEAVQAWATRVLRRLQPE